MSTSTGAPDDVQGAGREAGPTARRALAVVGRGLAVGLAITTANAVKSVAVPAFGAEWTAAMDTLGLSMATGAQDPAATAFYVATSVAYGLVAALGYVVLTRLRPAGTGTAALAGLALWVLCYALPMVGYAGMGIFPWRLTALSCALAGVEFVAATVVGTWRWRPAVARRLSA